MLRLQPELLVNLYLEEEVKPNMVEPDPTFVIATTTYGKEFCSVYGRDGLWATQFHPEKSGRPGLTILRNFYDYCEARHAQ